MKIRLLSRKEIYYTDGDWSVRLYYNNYASQICHTHSDGTAHLIPVGYTLNNGGCHMCDASEPEGARIVWSFFNWDIFNMETSND